MRQIDTYGPSRCLVRVDVRPPDQKEALRGADALGVFSI